MALAQRMYPEKAIAGFSREDGTVGFFTIVNAAIRPGMTVVDFGAGRGEYVEETEAPYRRDLRILKGKCARVIGVDIDPVVRDNPAIDDAIVIGVDCFTGLPAESVDVIVSDWTFEHVADPAALQREFWRILKPGGWVCARTPNKWGYISLGARLVPNRLHHRILSYLQPERQQRDVFPTVYRLNSCALVRQAFWPARWAISMYSYAGEPAYFRGSEILCRTVRRVAGMLPSAMGTYWHIFLQKKAAP